MGFEPQTFRPTVRRANHCATGTGVFLWLCNMMSKFSVSRIHVYSWTKSKKPLLSLSDQLDRDGLHDLNIQADWQRKTGTYWVRYIHVELLGFTNIARGLCHLQSRGTTLTEHSLCLIENCQLFLFSCNGLCAPGEECCIKEMLLLLYINVNYRTCGLVTVLYVLGFRGQRLITLSLCSLTEPNFLERWLQEWNLWTSSS